MSEELRNAYANTLFLGHFSASFEFKPGETSPKSDAILTLFEAQAAVVITAWNPYSEPKTKEENEAAQQRLEAELKSQGVRFLPATGKGTADEWTEPSVLALGMGFAAAQELAVKYQQNAYLWIEKGFPAVLIYPDPEVLLDQASIVVVDNREQSTMGSSWREYLCVRWIEDRVELSVRMYEWLASVSDLSEDEDGELIVPIQIDGKVVVAVEDDAVVGGNLDCNDDATETFTLADIASMTEWINDRNWGESKVLQLINEKSAKF